MGPRSALSFRPSCSRSAANRDGPGGGVASGNLSSAALRGAGVHESSTSNPQVKPFYPRCRGLQRAPNLRRTAPWRSLYRTECPYGLVWHSSASGRVAGRRAALPGKPRSRKRTCSIEGRGVRLLARRPARIQAFRGSHCGPRPRGPLRADTAAYNRLA